MAKAFSSSAGAASADEPSLTASAIVARAAGSHILRIDGYSHTKVLGNGKFIASETFSVGGHCWRLHYPDGGTSTHSEWISVYLRLVQADVDDVKASYAISLLDHDGNKVPSYSRIGSLCSFSGRQGATNASWGFQEFLKRSDLEESTYLKDDVFSIRCDVTVAKEISTKALPISEVRHGV